MVAFSLNNGSLTLNAAVNNTPIARTGTKKGSYSSWVDGASAPHSPWLCCAVDSERAAAAAIAAGHADYPAFRHLFPDPRRRAKVLPVFYEATVRDAIPTARYSRPPTAIASRPPPSGCHQGAIRGRSGARFRAAPAFARIMIAGPRAFPTLMRYGANAKAAHRDELDADGRRQPPWQTRTCVRIPHWYLVVRVTANRGRLPCTGRRRGLVIGAARRSHAWRTPD